MLSIEEVKSLRLWTQHLTDKTDKFTVVRDLNGLQAQFMSNAFHGLRIRCNEDLPEDDFGMGLVKNWTVRGTVHIFDKKDLPLFIRKNYRNDDWSIPTWWNSRSEWSLAPERQKFFSHLILDTLVGSSKTRDELRVLCFENGMSSSEASSMFHPWGGGIRELCERGFINYSACDQKRFELCCEYEPMTDENAESELLRRYFMHFGPSTMKDAAYFLGLPQSRIRSVMGRLPVNFVSVNGVEHFYIGNLPDDLPDVPQCILLSGFDQLLLGYRKESNVFLPAEYLRGIFSLSGIVMPSILLNGKIVGRWKHKNGTMTFELFETVSAESEKIISETAERYFAVNKILFDEI